LLLSEDWRQEEMMKILNRPESFFKTFSSTFPRKEDAMFLVTGFVTVSQISNHCRMLSCLKEFVRD